MSAVLIESGPDTGAVWHYGDPLREQRWLEAGQATVDLRHRGVFSVAGPDRLTWLNSLSSQKLDALAPGEHVTAYLLDHQGHLEHVFGGVDDGETFVGHTEPGRLEALLGWLERMRFTAKVEVSDLTATHGMVIADGPRVVPLDAIESVLGERRAGVWASEALRIAAGQPRIFCDTDERTLPNEIGMPDGDQLGAGVHLHKGCYRGQETVARVYNIGRPPRRLVRLLLDGSVNELPEVGAPVLLGDAVVGRCGTSAQHHELGPIALALVKRDVAVDAALTVAGIAAAQELIVDPEVGLHVRENVNPGLKLNARRG